jgi:hypothetical protein
LVGRWLRGPWPFRLGRHFGDEASKSHERRNEYKLASGYKPYDYQ